LGSWEKVLKEIPEGKHRLVIYPYASVAYFGEQGNVTD
jgi:hypothetical protein